MAKSKTSSSSSWKVSIGSYTDNRTKVEHPTLGFWMADHRNYPKGRPCSYGRLRWEALLSILDNAENRKKVHKWLATQARNEAATQVAANKSAEQTGKFPVASPQMLGGALDPATLGLIAAQMGLSLVPSDTVLTGEVVEDDDDDDDTDKL
jgi:hypothetical protein